MGSTGKNNVAISVGSNVGSRLQNLRRAADGLASLLDSPDFSSVYETEPVHVLEQPRFLNVCCVGRTWLTPRKLLSELRGLEDRLGRRRGGERYGPRIIDLDLLLYEDVVIASDDLELPHPRMRERAFVLLPLREIAPDWRVPETGVDGETMTVAALAAAVSPEGVERKNLRLEED